MSSNNENTQLEQTTDDPRTYTLRGFNKKIFDLLASLAEEDDEEEEEKIGGLNGEQSQTEKNS
jgi:hypothetical protein